MSRKKTPALEKAKETVKTLSDEDTEALFEWIELLLEVRATERERKLKAGVV